MFFKWAKSIFILKSFGYEKTTTYLILSTATIRAIINILETSGAVTNKGAMFIVSSHKEEDGKRSK